MNIVDLKSEDPANRFAGCQRMATAIVTIRREKGRCFPEDLVARGFSRAETADQWRLACAMAELELQLLG